ncbi:hypothetical protein ACFLXT_05035 [Chloroflexota bacterium]
MAQYQLNQNSLGRARQEIIHALHSWKFWVATIIAQAILMITAYVITPDNSSGLTYTIVHAIALVIGMLAMVGIAFVVSLIVAPYRQRDEARALLLAKPKPVPLQNKGELIRSISEVRQTSGELLLAQEQLDDLNARSPYIAHVEAMDAKENAKLKFNSAMNKLDAEILLAGKPFESILSKLTGYISNQVWIKEDKPIFHGGEPEALGFRTALTTFGRIVGRINNVIQEIDELSGQVPRMEDSQGE